MDVIFKRSAAIALFATTVLICAYCQAAQIGDIVDQYDNATDLQKPQVTSNYAGQMVSVSAVVKNVTEESTFDEVNQTSRQYYKVVTEQQKTAKNNPYEIILIFKDINKTKDLNKGDKIDASGSLIKIEDQRLLLSVWLTCDTLSPEEKNMFQTIGQ